MSKVTMGVLATKLDNIKEILEGLEHDVKENTKFRYKAKATFATLTTVASVVGGGVVWALGKFFGDK